jgi:hypothetical protein
MLSQTGSAAATRAGRQQTQGLRQGHWQLASDGRQTRRRQRSHRITVGYGPLWFGVLLL